MTDFIYKAISSIFNRLSSLYFEGMYKGYRKSYEVNSSFRFNGKGIVFYGNGRIVCGPRSYIGEFSSIQSIDGCKVTIGANCQISHYVNIYTSNHLADKDFSRSDQMKTGDVIIGDHCWIGIKTTILGPVEIGENSCVGANSVVNRNLPPHSISIGVPAKVVKFKSYLSENKAKELALTYQDVLSEKLRKTYLV